MDKTIHPRKMIINLSVEYENLAVLKILWGKKINKKHILFLEKPLSLLLSSQVLQYCLTPIVTR